MSADVVLVRAVDPSGGDEPVERVLLTGLAIATVEGVTPHHYRENPLLQGLSTCCKE